MKNIVFNRKRHEASLLKGARAMHETLLSAIDKAGGVGASFQWENLGRMSVKELLMILGNNRVRFIYRKSRAKQKQW